MNISLSRIRRELTRGGFSLVETTLSLGVLSVGFLTLASLLAVGLKTAKRAHGSRDTTQIAQTLVEEAKQGTLAAGTSYFDFQGNPTNSPQAAYSAQSAFQSVSGNAGLKRLTLRIVPLGAPDQARNYAVVLFGP